MPKVNRETFQNSNVPNPVVKGKGKVEKIDFKEHTEDIKRIWEGKPPTKLVEQWKEKGIKGSYVPGTPMARLNKIRVLMGFNGNNLVGRCAKCDDLNTHLVKYRTQDITIIERYCEKHVPSP